MLRAVARRVQRAHNHVAELDLGPIGLGLVRKLGLRGAVDPHRQAVLEREASVARDVIGVGVRLEDSDEAHAALLAGSQIPLDRVGRVDDDGDACVLVTDDVGATAQVVVDELLEQHGSDASNGCGYIS